MLIHITPRLYRPLEVGFVGQCSLKQVRIPELDLVLLGGEHLRTGTPWPNKHYYCGGPKSSRKQLFGFLVETRGNVDSLTVICEWELDYWEGKSQTVEHTTKIIVLDEQELPLLPAHLVIEWLNGQADFMGEAVAKACYQQIARA